MVARFRSDDATLAFYEGTANNAAPMTRLVHSRATNPSNPRVRAAMLANQQAGRAGALEFAGGLLQADHGWAQAPFTLDSSSPLANGRPHWSNAKGGHLCESAICNYRRPATFRDMKKQTDK